MLPASLALLRGELSARPQAGLTPGEARSPDHRRPHRNTSKAGAEPGRLRQFPIFTSAALVLPFKGAITCPSGMAMIQHAKIFPEIFLNICLAVAAALACSPIALHAQQAPTDRDIAIYPGLHAP